MHGAVEAGNPITWFLIRTEPAKEPLAASILERSGYEVYSPMKRVWRRVVRHHKARVREARLFALFPSYVFVGLGLHTPDGEVLRELPCVVSLVSVDGVTPYQIPPKVVDELRQRFGDEIITGPELLRWAKARLAQPNDLVQLIDSAPVLRDVVFRVEAIRGRAAKIFASIFGGITVTTMVDNLDVMEQGACPG